MSEQTWNAHVTLYECSKLKCKGKKDFKEEQEEDCPVNIWESLYSHPSTIPSLVKNRVTKFETVNRPMKGNSNNILTDNLQRSFSLESNSNDRGFSSWMEEESNPRNAGDIVETINTALLNERESSLNIDRSCKPLQNEPSSTDKTSYFEIFIPESYDKDGAFNTSHKDTSTNDSNDNKDFALSKPEFSYIKYDNSKNMENNSVSKSNPYFNQLPRLYFRRNNTFCHSGENVLTYDNLPNYSSDIFNQGEPKITNVDYTADDFVSNIPKTESMQIDSRSFCNPNSPSHCAKFGYSLDKESKDESSGESSIFHELNLSPQRQEYEIPLPGTVRLQMQKLERCLKNVDGKESCSSSAPSATTIGRSFSSSCVCPERPNINHKAIIARSFSEKRTKNDLERGNVKHITEVLSKNVFEGDKIFKRTSQSLKQKNRRWERYEKLPRSHSLEALEKDPIRSTASKQSKKARSRDLMMSSQDLLNRLVEKSEAQILELEREQDEINVKNLVGLFEETQERNPFYKQNLNEDQKIGVSPKISPAKQQDSTKFSPTNVSQRNKFDLRRPRSESISSERNLPPVPLRKSSLDYDFRPVPKFSSKSIVRRSDPLCGSCSFKNQANTSKVNHSNQSSSKSSNVQLSKVGGGVWKFSNLIKLPPTQGNWSTCSTEIRRRKEQGKTHPLSKLVTRHDSLL